MSGLNLYLLGAPRIELDGVLAEPATRKATALLAYLAASNTAHSREHLALLFWPESDHTHARNSLRYTLSVLRKSIGAHRLQSSRETIALDPSAEFRTDVSQFRQLLEHVTLHEHLAGAPCPECLDRLVSAAELYQGDFLAGFTLPDCPDFESWRFFESEDLRGDLATALEQLARWRSQLQDYEAAIPYARHWLSLDPLHEPAHRQLIILYALAGQQAAALRQYEECKRLLEAELNASPHPSTTALYQRVRAREIGPTRRATPTALRYPEFLREETEPPSRPGHSFVEFEQELAWLHNHLDQALMGESRLVFITGGTGRGKTTLLSEFTRQAMDKRPDLISTLGTCTYSDPGDPYLPFRDVLAALCGELRAQWSVGAMSTDHARRVWSLLPEMGEILMQHGPELLETFVPGDQMLAHLNMASAGRWPQSSQLEHIIQRHRESLPDARQQHLHQQYTNVLRKLSARQPLIVGLDDLQWADPASVNLLFHLARRLGDCPVLLVGTYRPEVVARDRNGIPHPLQGPLAEFKRLYGDIWLDLQKTAQEDGRLFVDALVDQTPNHLDGSFREALYQRTLGHPLFTTELLVHLRGSGQLIQDEKDCWIEDSSLDWKTLPARVEGVIEERIGHLPESARELLTLASVEGERFSAQTLSMVRKIDLPDTVEILSDLLGKRHGLVTEGGMEQVGGQSIYQFLFRHVLFRQYLYDSLTPIRRAMLHGEIGAALETLYGSRTELIAPRLAYHFTRAGNRSKAMRYYFEAGERARRLYAVQEAIDYYYQALDLLAGEEDHVDHGNRKVRLCDGLGQTLLQQARYDEAQEAFVAMEEAAPEGTPEKAQAWIRLSTVQDRLGEHARSLESALLAEKAARAAQAEHDLATALLMQSWAHYMLGNGKEALVLGQKALDLATDLDDRRLMARSLNVLAAIWDMQGQYDQGIGAKERALALFRELDDRRWLGRMLGNLGNTALLRADFPMAASYYQEALVIARELGDQDGEILYLMHLGGAWVGLGRYRAAMNALEKVIVLGESKGWMGLSLTHYFLTEARLGLGDLEAARMAAITALQLARETGRREDLGAAWRCLGNVAARSQEPFQLGDEKLDAPACFSRSLEIFTEMDSQAERAQTLWEWARYELVSGDSGRGQSMRAEAEEIMTRLGVSR
ncbi:MAG: BTAD domain-containing putative transcriptional regulator [Chloroflexota bacterium]|nr:BTAD domain-containing putative transcriptional regulator [Chloroflexota bacterium]